jgi:hypothetical protein
MLRGRQEGGQWIAGRHARGAPVAVDTSCSNCGLVCGAAEGAAIAPPALPPWTHLSRLPRCTLAPAAPEPTHTHQRFLRWWDALWHRDLRP